MGQGAEECGSGGMWREVRRNVAGEEVWRNVTGEEVWRRCGRGGGVEECGRGGGVEECGRGGGVWRNVTGWSCRCMSSVIPMYGDMMQSTALWPIGIDKGGCLRQ